jgi:23S rRNA (adenine1618-N6)-methyltransferase
MVRESLAYGDQVSWFTTLVSKSEHLPVIGRAIGRAGASRSHVVEMAQGQKKSRLVAWGFGHVSKFI